MVNGLYLLQAVGILCQFTENIISLNVELLKKTEKPQNFIFTLCWSQRRWQLQFIYVMESFFGLCVFAGESCLVCIQQVCDTVT